MGNFIDTLKLSGNIFLDKQLIELMKNKMGSGGVEGETRNVC